MFAAVLAMGQVVAVRHRAAGAADLAALAAAGHALPSPTAACGKAAEVARAQGAEVVRCAVRGEIAEVTARVRFGPYAPEIRSRAGPAEAVGVPQDAMGPEAPAMRRGPAAADRLSAGDRPGAGRRPEAGGRGGERAPPRRGRGREPTRGGRRPGLGRGAYRRRYVGRPGGPIPAPGFGRPGGLRPRGAGEGGRSPGGARQADRPPDPRLSGHRRVDRPPGGKPDRTSPQLPGPGGPTSP
ncbi:Rv3654c family TadE-like protein [Streptomyces jumonjinensis]|uniref:Rv3654c family TadE-like protein n=1 Tax=Streptomyces jumonjinensis TaxID=1945 RepID=UPI00389A08DA